MIDRSFRNYSQMLRSPDLRLSDIHTEIFEGTGSFEQRFADSRRAMLFHVLAGDFLLTVENSKRSPIAIAPGTTVGFEDGRANEWRFTPMSLDSHYHLFYSNIPRHMGVLQSMDEGIIVIAPDEEPFATILHHTVTLYRLEHQNAHRGDDDAIIRRCAETCLIQLVRYARAQNSQQTEMFAHDEHLLRAWSAYFSDPQARWTVKALADAAGLSRTAFAERFRKIVGTPPLHTLTIMRLEQAETMLRHSPAPLIEIAFTVGYNSEAAFVRAFHRQYGMPPGRFRATVVKA